ncbi:MAG: TIGR03905 family TSCPD domain-containing protein [Candidatus Gastranaerophilales bacterium]|nr:TIGR03905 family TSCPD domain-containing protein [Candidatus Gastranaerophilales bacterium]
MNYQTKGTCCKQINIEIENEIIKDIEFLGGCQGNLQGIKTLVIGMNIKEVSAKLKGILCGNKPTSCPDQLATCLLEYIEYKAKTLVN